MPNTESVQQQMAPANTNEVRVLLSSQQPSLIDQHGTNSHCLCRYCTTAAAVYTLCTYSLCSGCWQHPSAKKGLPILYRLRLLHRFSRQSANAHLSTLNYCCISRPMVQVHMFRSRRARSMPFSSTPPLGVSRRTLPN